MFFYLIWFVVFLILYFFAERSNKKWALFIAAIPPILLEGLRDELLGDDMAGYGTLWFYDMSTKDSAGQIIDDAITPEYGYHLMIYFCKMISTDIHLYMTVCAAIKIIMVYLAAFALRKKMDSISFLFGYFCFFYVLGFSLMRQSIAVAISFYALTFFMERKLWKFIALVIIAYLFHSSAILMVIYIPLYFLKDYKYKYVLLVFCLASSYILIETLFPLLIASPLFKSSMADLYIDSGVTSAKSNILLSLFTLFYGVLLYIRMGKKMAVDIWYMISTSLISLTFLALASYIEVAFRMSYYMFMMGMVLTYVFITKKKQLRVFITPTCWCLFLLHFYLSCTHGLNGALDYTSKIIGIV